MRSIAVIGGGAAGMLAALTAANDKDNRVTIFERQGRVGRKLMATGNGRCNLTNTGASVSDYHGADPEFAAYALKAFSPEKTVEFFRRLGLICTEQYGGRVYPLSDSAGSVLDVLRFAIDREGIELHTAEPVTHACLRNGKFCLRTETAEYRFGKVIVACGGKAGGKLGGVGDGYELLKSFGHSCTKLYPALVPLRTDTEYPRSLKGIRADAALKLYSGETLTAEGAGELQFTENGISGPAAFDISREASVSGGRVVIDLFRNMTEHEILDMLIRRREMSSGMENANAFAGMLQSRLGMVLVKYAGLRPSGLLGELSSRELEKLAYSAKHFTLEIRGTDSFDSAQVTAGGISTSEFSPYTLESRLVRGLYACGEVLDIDGNCGGYNLQWAWASGYLAGRLKND